jgi:hypothetical protein
LAGLFFCVGPETDPEAKTEAQILHLDDNQSALLKAAKVSA